VRRQDPLIQLAIAIVPLVFHTCFLAGCAGTATSGNSGNSSKTSAVSVSVQPANQSVTAGQMATFSVTATGTAPITYQWQKNGTNISGATAATYTTPTTSLADNGARFDLVVSNSAATVTSSSATLTVNPTTSAPTITTQPANQTVTVGPTATFAVSATGTSPFSYQWQKNGANISAATAASYTTPATVAADKGASFDVVVSNSVGTVTSSSATLTVRPVTTTSSVDVIIYHYDNLRTGQNINETTLTPANVNPTKFGKLGSFSVDGKVDAQPLYLSNVAIPGSGMRNVLYVVTEHDSVFAFDADSINGTTTTSLWKVSLLQSSESPSDDRGCGQVTPEIGITSTPVIDRARNAIYVVSVSKNANGNYFHRIHALDLTTGGRTLWRAHHNHGHLSWFRRQQLQR
jgi:hypothetical protein